MYEVQRYASNELPPGIEGQVASFIRLVWNGGGTGEDRFWSMNDPSGKDEHFVIAERGVLVSYAVAGRRMITHLGSSYRLLGVGGVMTYPAFRHEGHGTRLVAAVTDYIRGSDVDMGMLFTGIDLHPFYQANGWIPLKREGVYYGDPAAPKFADAHTMMLYVSEHAKAHRDDFEQGDLFVGESMW
jgi:GNAT superfamily N-acetyltransferase